MEQRTSEWHAARAGKVTASRVSDVMAKLKSGGYSSSRANYMADLVVERFTGSSVPGYINADMQWGIDQEDKARSAYENRTGVLVSQVGFIDHPSIPMSGASPDGWFSAGSNKIGLEIKCPKTATHIETLRRGALENKGYIDQMHWQAACAGYDAVEFVSFDPRMPEDMQLFIQRIDIDRAYIKTMESEVVKFLHELDDMIDELEHKYRKG